MRDIDSCLPRLSGRVGHGCELRMHHVGTPGGADAEITSKLVAGTAPLAPRYFTNRPYLNQSATRELSEVPPHTSTVWRAFAARARARARGCTRAFFSSSASCLSSERRTRSGGGGVYVGRVGLVGPGLRGRVCRRPRRRLERAPADAQGHARGARERMRRGALPARDARTLSVARRVRSLRVRRTRAFSVARHAHSLCARRARALSVARPARESNSSVGLQPGAVGALVACERGRGSRRAERRIDERDCVGACARSPHAPLAARAR